MGKRKQQNIKFICKNEPDEYCINNFHKSSAKGLINEYGIEKIKVILKNINPKYI